MTKQILTLQGELPAINEILAASKSHYSHYARVKRHNTTRVALECLSQKIKPIDSPIAILFAHYRPNKRKDPDNVAGGAQKMTLDGLVQGKIIPDDTMKYIQSIHHSFFVDAENPRIEVILYAG